MSWKGPGARSWRWSMLGVMDVFGHGAHLGRKGTVETAEGTMGNKNVGIVMGILVSENKRTKFD